MPPLIMRIRRILPAWAAILIAALLVSPVAANGTVAITIDDGPHYSFTARAVNIAEQLGATFTFFVCGYFVEADPRCVPLMLEHGHEVENHSYNHPELTRLSDDDVEWQIRRTSELIRQQGGAEPLFVRPPYGAYNRHVGQLIHSCGQRVALWTVDPTDWKVQNPAAVAAAVLSHAHDGSVILLHQKPSTLLALPIIIKGLHKKGLDCVSLAEMWGIDRDLVLRNSNLAPIRSLVDDNTRLRWNQEEFKATITKGKTQIVLTVGNRTALVNGSPEEMTTAPTVYNNQLYVQSSFLHDAMQEHLVETGPPPTELPVKPNRKPPAPASNGKPRPQPRPQAPSAQPVPTAPLKELPATAAKESPSPAGTPEMVQAPEATGPVAVIHVPTHVIIETKPDEHASPATPLRPASAVLSHLRIALKYKRAGELPAAADEYLLALKEDPANDDALWGLAWAYYDMKLPRMAIQQFQRVIANTHDPARAEQARRTLAHLMS